MITQGHNTPHQPTKPATPSKPDNHKPTHNKVGKPTPAKPSNHKPSAHKPTDHKPSPPKKSAAVWELDLSETPDPLRGLKEGGHIH